MPKTEENDAFERNYEVANEYEMKRSLSNSSSPHFQDVNEEIFSGDDSIEYIDLLESLEEIYDLEGLSEYGNPEKVRISHYVSGSGLSWENTICVKVDETQKKLDWIPDFLSPVRERFKEEPIENWGKIRKKYMTGEKTYTHMYSDKDISICEMEEFIDSFLD